eukprot:TRINITY_DN51533_c0_g1_i1.p1 TRINITY_DN51533_c0_g1~~TRINITY_DN51533_c0_g1_i1.p1  ORF type:complete len:144 (-),score=22.06 TRINITY_DN51533_c0_g1_i1:26-457(-)
MHFVARASILQHFATHQNLGEIQKKFNSFGMVNFTIASALGIGFTTLCGSFTAHFVAIVVASTLSIGLTYASTSHFAFRVLTPATGQLVVQAYTCLLYTSDAADEEDSVDLGGRRIIKKKKRVSNEENTRDTYKRQLTGDERQ